MTLIEEIKKGKLLTILPALKRTYYISMEITEAKNNNDADHGIFALIVLIIGKILIFS